MFIIDKLIFIETNNINKAIIIAIAIRTPMLTVGILSNRLTKSILAVVLLLCGGIPLRNKIYKERKKKKEDKKKGI